MWHHWKDIKFRFSYKFTVESFSLKLFVVYVNDRSSFESENSFDVLIDLVVKIVM